jgi:6-phosphogluconolactonase
VSAAAEQAELRIFDSAEESATDCAQRILSLLASPNGARATFAISGGNTPRLLFSDLAKAKFDWGHVHIFWVDERAVPPTDKDSNFRMANETLLEPARIPQSNIHRIQAERPAKEAAEEYVRQIQEFFGLKEKSDLPVFDVVHRGMGPDGHTASLFPGSPLVNDRTGIAASVYVEKMKMDRITLLPGVLLAAKQTILQAGGADKADVLKEVLYGPEDFSKYPCQIASRGRRATWYLDKAAAAKL